MTRQYHRITYAATLTLALAAAAAPCAWADPYPLAQAEAAIAASQHPASPIVVPNPDEQVPWTYDTPAPSNHIASQPVQPKPDEQTVAGAAAHTELPSEVVPSGGHAAGSVTATVVRVGAHDLNFNWGDAGIGAVAALVLVGIGLAGTRALTSSRKRHAREQRAAATS